LEVQKREELGKELDRIKGELEKSRKENTELRDQSVGLKNTVTKQK